jgi:hypothetical protein
MSFLTKIHRKDKSKIFKTEFLYSLYYVYNISCFILFLSQMKYIYIYITVGYRCRKLRFPSLPIFIIGTLKYTGKKHADYITAMYACAEKTECEKQSTDVHEAVWRCICCYLLSRTVHINI